MSIEYKQNNIQGHIEFSTGNLLSKRGITSWLLRKTMPVFLLKSFSFFVMNAFFFSIFFPPSNSNYSALKSLNWQHYTILCQKHKYFVSPYIFGFEHFDNPRGQSLISAPYLPPLILRQLVCPNIIIQMCFCIGLNRNKKKGHENNGMI